MSLLATYPIFAWHTFKYNVILLVFIVAVITINIAVCIKNLKRKSVGETTAAERVKQMGNKTLILLIFFIDLIGLYLFITSFDSVYHLHSSWYNSAFYPEEIMVLFIISAAIILCSIIYFVSAIINNKSKLSYIFRQSIFYTFAALIIFFVHVLFRPEPFYLVIDIIMGLGVVSWFVYLLIRKYKKKQLPVDKNETSEENERQKENL
jgi:hypothetical protein